MTDNVPSYTDRYEDEEDDVYPIMSQELSVSMAAAGQGKVIKSSSVSSSSRKKKKKKKNKKQSSSRNRSSNGDSVSGTARVEEEEELGGLERSISLMGPEGREAVLTLRKDYEKKRAAEFKALQKEKFHYQRQTALLKSMLLKQKRAIEKKVKLVKRKEKLLKQKDEEIEMLSARGSRPPSEMSFGMSATTSAIMNGQFGRGGGDQVEKMIDEEVTKRVQVLVQIEKAKWEMENYAKYGRRRGDDGDEAEEQEAAEEKQEKPPKTPQKEQPAQEQEEQQQRQQQQQPAESLTSAAAAADDDNSKSEQPPMSMSEIVRQAASGLDSTHESTTDNQNDEQPQKQAELDPLPLDSDDPIVKAMARYQRKEPINTQAMPVPESHDNGPFRRPKRSHRRRRRRRRRSDDDGDGDGDGESKRADETSDSDASDASDYFSTDEDEDSDFVVVQQEEQSRGEQAASDSNDNKKDDAADDDDDADRTLTNVLSPEELQRLKDEQEAAEAYLQEIDSDEDSDTRADRKLQQILRKARQNSRSRQPQKKQQQQQDEEQEIHKKRQAEAATTTTATTSQKKNKKNKQKDIDLLDPIARAIANIESTTAGNNTNDDGDDNDNNDNDMKDEEQEPARRAMSDEMIATIRRLYQSVRQVRRAHDAVKQDALKLPAGLRVMQRKQRHAAKVTSEFDSFLGRTLHQNQQLRNLFEHRR